MEKLQSWCRVWRCRANTGCDRLCGRQVRCRKSCGLNQVLCYGSQCCRAGQYRRHVASSTARLKRQHYQPGFLATPWTRAIVQGCQHVARPYCRCCPRWACCWHHRQAGCHGGSGRRAQCRVIYQPTQPGRGQCQRCNAESRVAILQGDDGQWHTRRRSPQGISQLA